MFFTVLLAFMAGMLSLPIILLTIYLRLPDAAPSISDTDELSRSGNEKKDKPDDEPPAAGEAPKPLNHHTNLRIHRMGWMTMRRTFEPTADSSATAQNASDAGSIMNSAFSRYQSFMDSRSKDPRRSRPKDRFFCVLEGPQLSLYEDEEATVLRYLIKVPLHQVVIFPEHLIDGELFMKRNAICLRPILPAGSEGVLEHHEATSVSFSRPTPNPSNNDSALTGSTDIAEHGGLQPYFLFPKINIDKEDWYHSLIASSRLADPALAEKDAQIFSMEDMSRFVGSIDEHPDAIPVRWLNALIGRLFFSVHRTCGVQDYIRRKLMKKLSKVSLPGYIGDIKVEQVDVGDTVPLISKPMLKELKADGDYVMECQVKYTGNFKLQLATSVNFEIGTKKPYTLAIKLSAVVQQLEGTIQVKIKKSPTNRIWWGFTTMPRMVLELVPELGPKSVRWGMVTNIIESKLREAIMESIVGPHMDDIAFMDTMNNLLRGGIFGDCLKKEGGETSATTAEHASESESEDVKDGGLMPGVPNLKLGDDKEADGLRQRPTQARKVSDPTSVKSTQSSKLSSLFGGSSGYTPSGDGESLRSTTTSKDHSRKKSWFTNSTGSTSSSPAKSRLQSTDSDTALPLASNSTNASLEMHASTDARKGPRKSEPLHSSASTGSLLDSAGDGAADRLREILESGKARSNSTPGDPALAIGNSSGNNSLEAPSTLERAVSAPPAQGPLPSLASVSAPLARSSSASSDETTRTTPAPSIASSSPDYAKYIEETASTTTASTGDSKSSKPSLFRKKSDKAESSAQSISSSGSAQDLSTANTSSIFGPSPSINGTGNTSTSALLNSWKAKAADKQAIQDGVNQAKQHMAKWSNTWKAYRKQGMQDRQAAEAAPEDLDVGDLVGPGSAVVDLAPATTNTLQPNQATSAAAPPLRRVPSFSSMPASPVLGHAIEKTTSRSRSGSIVSTSPTGHFKPAAPVATTSLSTGDAVSMLSEPSSHSSPSNKPSSSSSVRRVPPPSSVPVHPAFAGSQQQQPKRNSLSGPGKTSQPTGYRPAAMMAIPGIDDSRRYNLSSADAAKSQSVSPPSSLTKTNSVSAAATPALPRRPSASVEPVQLEEELAAAQNPFSEEVAAVPAQPGTVKAGRERMPSSNDADDSGVNLNAVPELSVDLPAPKE